MTISVVSGGPPDCKPVSIFCADLSQYTLSLKMVVCPVHKPSRLLVTGPSLHKIFEKNTTVISDKGGPIPVFQTKPIL